MNRRCCMCVQTVVACACQHRTKRWIEMPDKINRNLTPAKDGQFGPSFTMVDIVNLKMIVKSPNW